MSVAIGVAPAAAVRAARLPKRPVRTTSGRTVIAMNMGLWIAIGVAIGVGIGSAMDNIGAGIAIGIGVGIAIGAALDARNKKDKKPPE